VADLVFDCVYVVNLATDKKKRRLLSGLKNSAEFLGEVARYGLSPQRTSDPEPRLWQIRYFLEEMQRQLLVANGLGALNDRLFDKLQGRTSSLQRAFHHPRLDVLFDQQGRPI